MDIAFLAIEILIVVGGAIYIVARLEATVKRLVESIDRLTKRIDHIDDQHTNTRERVIALEATQER